MTDSGYIHRCSAGETFDSVALRVYGDEKYAAELMSTNVELCEKLVFTGGEILVLPVVTVDTDAYTGQPITAAPWKE